MQLLLERFSFPFKLHFCKKLIFKVHVKKKQKQITEKKKLFHKKPSEFHKNRKCWQEDINEDIGHDIAVQSCSLKAKVLVVVIANADTNMQKRL